VWEVGQQRKADGEMILCGLPSPIRVSARKTASACASPRSRLLVHKAMVAEVDKRDGCELKAQKWVCVWKLCGCGLLFKG